MNTNDLYKFELEQIGKVCPEIVEPIVSELKRNRESLNMIASENYPSLAVQYACSLPCFNTKYCEGYPGHRYYGGCENMDKIESYACRLACDLFGAEHAYVQPHSGADANLIAYYAVLNKRVIQPHLERLISIKEIKKKSLDELSEAQYEVLREAFFNQTLLSLELSSGGHLTHGSRQNLSSKLFKIVHYPLDSSGLINYNIVEEYAIKYRPLILLVGYSAYTRKIDFSRMREIADKSGSVLMVDMAHFAGLVAGKVFTGVYNPVPYADIVTTTTHKTLRGPRGGMILCKNEWADYIDKGCPSVIGGPLENQIAAKAIAFKEALSEDFQEYAHQIVRNSQALAENLMDQGVPLLTGGTDNHMVIIDVRKYGITGKQAEDYFKRAGITCNRNTIPNDPNGVWKTSGIRLGTAALTTLGMKEKEMEFIGSIISSILNSVASNKENLDKILIDSNNKVKELLNKYKLYPELLKEN